jgi:hypothetical protein
LSGCHRKGDGSKRDTYMRYPYYLFSGGKHMSSVIEFLEKLGADARLRQGTSDELALALAEARIEASASEAILSSNVEELYAVLKQAPMFCVQTVPEDDEEDDGDEEQETSNRNTGASPAGTLQAVELA